MYQGSGSVLASTGLMVGLQNALIATVLIAVGLALWGLSYKKKDNK